MGGFPSADEEAATAGVRKYRPFGDGLINGSNRDPLRPYRLGPMNGR
jgi:hypothetical protein